MGAEIVDVPLIVELAAALADIIALIDAKPSDSASMDPAPFRMPVQVDVQSIVEDIKDTEETMPSWTLPGLLSGKPN